MEAFTLNEMNHTNRAITVDIEYNEPNMSSVNVSFVDVYMVNRLSKKDHIKCSLVFYLFINTFFGMTCIYELFTVRGNFDFLCLLHSLPLSI